MKSTAIIVLLGIAGCGSVQRTTRVGTIYAAEDGSRAFVGVERWATVTEPLDDADGNPVTHDNLLEATLFEIRIADGQVIRRHHEDGWLVAYGYDPAADIVWLARDPDPDRPARAVQFGLGRDGVELGVPVTEFELLSPRLAAVPRLRTGEDVGLWDPIGGRRATLRGGWPIAGRWALDAATRTLTACRVRDRTITVARAALDTAFDTGTVEASTAEVDVVSDAGTFDCVASPDGTRVAAVFVDRLDLLDVAGVRPPRIIVLPQRVVLVGGAFAGPKTLVLPAAKQAAVLVDLDTGAARTVDPGCCRGGSRFPLTGAVTFSDDRRGLIVTADGRAVPLASTAEIRFARATGEVPWPLPSPVNRLTPIGPGVVVTAGVARGQVVVQVVDRSRTRLRVTLDDRAR